MIKYYFKMFREIDFTKTILAIEKFIFLNAPVLYGVEKIV